LQTQRTYATTKATAANGQFLGCKEESGLIRGHFLYTVLRNNGRDYVQTEWHEYEYGTETGTS